MSRRPRIAISLGDPCGIGPELLLRSLPMLQTWADVTVVGSRAGVDLLESITGKPVIWRWADPPESAPEGFHGLACGLHVEGADGSVQQGGREHLLPGPREDVSHQHVLEMFAR